MTCEQLGNMAKSLFCTGFSPLFLDFCVSCAFISVCRATRVILAYSSAASVQNGVVVWVCVCMEECSCAASNAQNCYSRDLSCAWFTAYILICSHGLSYHRIKYVNVPVEGSLWQRQPHLNTISLNEATQSAFTTDTDSSLFGTSSVGLFGYLFMPLCESLGMKERLRQGMYIMGVRKYLRVFCVNVLYRHT